LKDLILFDLDGTLTDPKEGIINSYRYALAAFGIQEEDTSLTRFIGPPLRESFAALGFSPGETEKAVAVYREYFSTEGIFQNAVYPGVPKMLETLRGAGFTLCVATNKAEVYAQTILEHYNLSQYIAYTSGDSLDGTLASGGKKEIIRRALEAVSAADLTRAVMAGDRKHDILGAKESGIASVGVLYGYGSREELEAAGADRIAGSPEELTALLLGGF
jgi:phosphoglycolate phosphatase